LELTSPAKAGLYFSEFQQLSSIISQFTGGESKWDQLEMNIIATNLEELDITNLEDSDLILSISIGNGF